MTTTERPTTEAIYAAEAVDFDGGWWIPVDNGGRWYISRRRALPAEPTAPTLDVDVIEDILADAESDGIIGPDYTPRRLAQYIVDSLAAPAGEDR